MSDLLLPEDGLLLHVGPHKTGTTAVQSAFFRARRALRAEGVSYPGRSRTPTQAVIAVTGGSPMTGEPPVDIRDWQRFVASVPERGRVVVSNEFFADAQGAAVERVVTDLGRDRVHVVVTLRALDRIVPSQWQQYVQNGRRGSWRRWLKGILLDDVPTSSRFWVRHRHDVLVRRWADVVGPDRVTVVVVDESDRSALLRVFEAMVGAPDGVLVPEPDRLNRSLTLPEVELVRALNREFRARDWDPRDYRRFVRMGVNQMLKSAPPDPDASRVELPRWAITHLRDVSQEIVVDLRASGVHVVGELDSLVVDPARSPRTRGAHPRTTSLPADVAARAVAGAIEAALEPQSGLKPMLRRARQLPPSEIIERVLPRGRRG
ncbi:hypothetical protein FE697_011670 [Mumia zhuanghuii]|uniref:Sulfotransferase family protein n=2 Tax=Mumia TaxID=1546255 RepID=A0ABW1QH66_9ACTN|nr:MULTISPECIES: hypothetical protein [Mumia]KAA1422807.1 hypothetical protein FE697_011670 [Mumia zhuanghuii]